MVYIAGGFALWTYNRQTANHRSFYQYIFVLQSLQTYNPQSLDTLSNMLSFPILTLLLACVTNAAVLPVFTDVRGTSPIITDLILDIVSPSENSFSVQGLTPDMLTTDKMLFLVTMGAFLTAKRAAQPSSLDWGDDGCSHSEDHPAGFNFLESCFRHDFGYANYKRQGRFTEANRKRLDDNFLADLNRMCEKRSLFQALACKATAVVYHTAVRRFGNL